MNPGTEAKKGSQLGELYFSFGVSSLEEAVDPPAFGIQCTRDAFCVNNAKPLLDWLYSDTYSLYKSIHNTLRLTKSNGLMAGELVGVELYIVLLS